MSAAGEEAERLAFRAARCYRMVKDGWEDAFTVPIGTPPAPHRHPHRHPHGAPRGVP